MNRIQRPIGVEPAVESILTICGQTEIYQKCGILPPNYIFTLDTSNGLTTLTEFIAHSFYESRIKRFNSGIDLYLEYEIEGTIRQLKSIFYDIKENAVYSNEYNGIVALDTSKLFGSYNDDTVNFLVENAKLLSKNATLIFYIPTEKTRQVELLLKKLLSISDNIEYIELKPYSLVDLVLITERILLHYGVYIRLEEATGKLIEHIIKREGIADIKSVNALCERLARYADYSSITPYLGIDGIRAYKNTHSFTENNNAKRALV